MSFFQALVNSLVIFIITVDESVNDVCMNVWCFVWSTTCTIAGLVYRSVLKNALLLPQLFSKAIKMIDSLASQECFSF